MSGRLVAVLLAGVVGSGCLGTYRLTASQLQERLAARFPVTRSANLVSVSLYEPAVSFPGEDGQVALALTVRGDGLGVSGQARARVQGKISYDGEQGAFFLRGPREVQVSDVRVGAADAPAPVPVAVEAVLQAVVPLVVGQVLDALPVYVLDPQRPDEAKVKDHVKAVRARDGALLIELK